MYSRTHLRRTASCLALAAALSLACVGSSRAQVLLGSRAALDVDGSPIALAAVDIDLDGAVDLVTANEAGGDGASISVLPGYGNGSFRPEERLNLSPSQYIVHAIAAGDLDGDGTGDLAVAVDDIRQFPPTAAIIVFRNDGRGQFLGREVYPFDGVLPRCLAAADVTGDARTDLVACATNREDGSGLLAILAGMEDGTLSVREVHPAGATPVGIEIADADADGTVDVLVIDGEETALTALWGDGTGGFVPGTIDVGVLATSARVVGDSDYDLPILIVTSAAQSGIQRFTQAPPREFSWDASVEAQDPPSDSAAVDVDGDGALELVTVSASNRRIAVWQVSGGDLERRQRLTVDDGPAAMLVDDFDGDGQPDVAVAASGADVADVFLNGRSPAATPTAGHAAPTATADVAQVTPTPTANDGRGTPVPTATPERPATPAPTATCLPCPPPSSCGPGMTGFYGDGCRVCDLQCVPFTATPAATPTATATPAPEPGDANCDGVVNDVDVSELIWQMFRPYCDGADVNGDGMMSAADIVLLMEILEEDQ